MSGGGRGSRSDDEEQELSRGTKVSVNYHGRGEYFPGSISRVNSNGTYDISYDDGDKELEVKRGYIKVSGGGPGNTQDTSPTNSASEASPAVRDVRNVVYACPH